MAMYLSKDMEMSSTISVPVKRCKKKICRNGQVGSLLLSATWEAPSPIPVDNKPGVCYSIKGGMDDSRNKSLAKQNHTNVLQLQGFQCFLSQKQKTLPCEEPLCSNYSYPQLQSSVNSSHTCPCCVTAGNRQGRAKPVTSHLRI